MKYEVIHYFTDLQDFGHPYNVGDSFPRNGLKVSDARLKELSGSNNKQHKPLIKAVEEAETVKEVEEKQPKFSDKDIELEEEPSTVYTKTEINRLTTAELQELANREGIENAYEKSGGELKKVLIAHFGL